MLDYGSTLCQWHSKWLPLDTQPAAAGLWRGSSSKTTWPSHFEAATTISTKMRASRGAWAEAKHTPWREMWQPQL